MLSPEWIHSELRPPNVAPNQGNTSTQHCWGTLLFCSTCSMITTAVSKHQTQRPPEPSRQMVSFAWNVFRRLRGYFLGQWLHLSCCKLTASFVRPNEDFVCGTPRLVRLFSLSTLVSLQALGSSCRRWSLKDFSNNSSFTIILATCRNIQLSYQLPHSFLGD